MFFVFGIHEEASISGLLLWSLILRTVYFQQGSRLVNQFVTRTTRLLHCDRLGKVTWTVNITFSEFSYVQGK